MVDLYNIFIDTKCEKIFVATASKHCLLCTVLMYQSATYLCSNTLSSQLPKHIQHVLRSITPLYLSTDAQSVDLCIAIVPLAIIIVTLIIHSWLEVFLLHPLVAFSYCSLALSLAFSSAFLLLSSLFYLFFCCFFTTHSVFPLEELLSLPLPFSSFTKFSSLVRNLAFIFGGAGVLGVSTEVGRWG